MTRIILMAVMLTILVIPAWAESAKERLEKLARELTILDTQYVIHGCSVYLGPDLEGGLAVERAKIDGLADLDREALIELLRHGDPKVRTLAMVGLYDRNDPSILPHLIPLVNDPVPTFPSVMPISMAFPVMEEPPLQEQTVGAIAFTMMNTYMSAAGFHYGVHHDSQPGFAEYWAERGGRDHCASWFAVMYMRAASNCYPIPEGGIERIGAVREKIDALPGVERLWYLMYLGGEKDSEHLIGEAELLDVARELGRERLLLMLQRRIDSDDPDLQPRDRKGWPFERMGIFILKHADELLEPEDADTLLAREMWERDYMTHGVSDAFIHPWWAIGAAKLQPERAKDILHAAYDRFDDKFDTDERGGLCYYLWEMVGEEEIPFLVNWIYTIRNEYGMTPNSRASFIRRINKDVPAWPMLEGIARDRRLALLDWPTLEKLVEAINKWSDDPIVSHADLEKARHPYGSTHYHNKRREAEKEYPEETRQLRETLDNWRAAVKAWATR